MNLERKKVDERVPCKYGADCYQKNPAHHEKYRHPEKEKDSPPPAKRVKNDEPEKLQEVPESPPAADVDASIDKLKERLKELFLVEVPDELFSFYDFCKSVNSGNPAGALSVCGLTLCGPFDVLSNSFKFTSNEDSLRHCRYFYDPPEFQTILKGDPKTQFHMGYWRDSPSDQPVFVASNEANCTITPIADNVFAAVNHCIEQKLKKIDPFVKVKVQKLQKQLLDFAKSKSIPTTRADKNIRARNSKVVTKTFHGAGIVVPYDIKTEVGYRPLVESTATIKQYFKKIVEVDSEQERSAYWAKLNPVITFANIATDECDFGTGLELGIDMFTWGSELFHSVILQLLPVAYSLLGRSEFSLIIEAHLKDRKKVL